jgi:hypothetical protein
MLLLVSLVAAMSGALSARPALAVCGEDQDCIDGIPDGWYDAIEAIEIGEKYRPIIEQAISDWIDSMVVDRPGAVGSAALAGDDYSPFGGFGEYDWR